MLINKTEPLADHTIEEHSESPYGDHKQYTPHTRAGEHQVEIRPMSWYRGTFRTARHSPASTRSHPLTFCFPGSPFPPLSWLLYGFFPSLPGDGIASLLSYYTSRGPVRSYQSRSAAPRSRRDRFRLRPWELLGGSEVLASAGVPVFSVVCLGYVSCGFTDPVVKRCLQIRQVASSPLVGDAAMQGQAGSVVFAWGVCGGLEERRFFAEACIRPAAEPVFKEQVIFFCGCIDFCL